MKKYLIRRLMTWALTIFAGITIIFFLQRLSPGDPVENMVMRMYKDSSVAVEDVDLYRETLRERYGLTGSLWQQYINTMIRLLQFDFGVSLVSYPTKVSDIIARALPYTVCLLLTMTVLSWVIGNALGLVVGYKRDKWYAKAIETVAMCMHPIPYFLTALIVLVMLAYVFPFFPLVTSFGDFHFSLEWFKNALRNAFMPALSLLIANTGWWIISMKSLASNVAEEEYVNYARLKGLSEGHIGYCYVFRNCILSQVTGLAMRIGSIFGGSMMCEVIFGYPGLGRLLRESIEQMDYNMLMGIIFISIVATATAALIIDLAYPLFDPRIRYS